jgi:Tol biopolymer transport system component
MVAITPTNLDSPDALVFKRVGGGTVKRFRLSTGRVEYFADPVWARDGRAVVVEFHDGHRERLLVASLRTGVRSVSRNASRNDSSPEWSPSGHRIGFLSCDSGAQCAPALMRPDGSGRTELVPGRGFDLTGPRWAPNGRAIAIAAPFGVEYPPTTRTSEPRKRFGIYLVRPDGSNLRRVGATAPIELTSGGIDFAWSRDSRWLASSDTGGISIVSAAGGRQRRLTTLGKRTTVSWGPSPRILFVHRGGIYTLLPGRRPVKIQPR